MSFNLATILRESAAKDPTRPLLTFGDAALSYAQVDEDSGRVASSLRALGLEPGDKVAVHLPNVPEFVITYFGVLKAGMVMVPLNPMLTARELAFHLGDSDARLLVTFAQFADVALAAATVVGGIEVYTVGPSETSAPEGSRDFEELLAGSDSGDLVATSADDTAVLLYTSGTTGKPKGAELTHFQLFMNCTTSGALFEATEDDVMIVVLPLFHVFGLSSVLSLAVRYGASLVMLPRFEPAAVMDAVERHGVTIFAGVPTMYVALLAQETSGRDLSSLRIAISGGASMPGEVIRAFEAKIPGLDVLEGYGLSETASTAAFNVSAEQRKVLSVGKPIWGVDIVVVGQDGTELPRGAEHVGEIVIRGHNVLKGYYKNPEATARAVRDGWFRTGDLGYRDADGYLFIVDRLKDMVIRGGYNVYPREVEEVLYEHPDVVEAAVVGRADERLGEEVVAYVVLRDGAQIGADGLLDHCRERLAAYKYPRDISVLTQLPKGPTGKILKRELRR